MIAPMNIRVCGLCRVDPSEPKAMSHVRELILGLPDGRGLALLGIDCLKDGKFGTGLRS
jgi:hypothetical protein